MKALIQRVRGASVRVQGTLVASIGPGLLVLLGVACNDDEATADRMAERVRALRIFADERGRMNEALGDREVLCVSQFTLCADTRRGNRPAFTTAAEPDRARILYERFCVGAGAHRGRFGSHMEVELVNDGPVTLMLDSNDAG